jgi:hypothetical protein
VVAGDANDDIDFITSAVVTLCIVKHTGSLQSPSGDRGAGRSTLMSARDDIIFSTVSTKNLFTAFAVILHIVGDDRGHGGCA